MTPGTGRARSLGWLFGHLRGQRRKLVLVLALSFVGTGLALIQPLLTRDLIDNGLIAGRFDVVAGVSGLLVAAALAGAAVGGFNRWYYVRASGEVLFSLRESVYRHLQRLSPAFYARRPTGDLLARLDGDVAEIQRFAVDTLLASVNGVLALTGALAMMFGLSWQLALLAFVVLPAQILFLRKMRPRVEDRTRQVRERNGEITGFLVDSLGHLKLTQATGAEKREAGRLADLNQRYLGDLLRLELVAFATSAVPGSLTVAGTAAVFLAGGYMAVQGQLSVGTLVAFSFYLARAAGPAQTLLGLYVAARRARVSLDRVWELMESPSEVTDPAVPAVLPADGQGLLRLDAVDFAYPGHHEPVLQQASLTIPGREKTVIVGESGAGKSTFADLLHRHYDPSAGVILLDGVDLRALSLHGLRRAVAIVAQDIQMVPGSVADNIRYGAPEAGEAALRQAVEAAALGEWIAALPEGLATPVGNLGRRLSGGQRQRIALARAILQQPRLLVLDEATASVDRETEDRLVYAIDHLFAGRTRLIITHRPEVWLAGAAVFRLQGGAFLADPLVAAGAA